MQPCPAPTPHAAFPGGHCVPSESGASISRPPGNGRVARPLTHLTHSQSPQHLPGPLHLPNTEAAPEEGHGEGGTGKWGPAEAPRGGQA